MSNLGLIRAVRIAVFLAFFGLTACATADRAHVMVVSVPEQRMVLLEKGQPICSYRISTSKFGLGDSPGSCATPLGKLEIAQKIGGGAPIGMVFKDRHPTGEILRPNTNGRDPIVTRILWLRGLEQQNQNAFGRFIYIHGTPQERDLGRTCSYGCIRMRSVDVADLFDRVGEGARVEIRQQRIQEILTQFAQN